jgi:sulfonate transport system substrate-binding protein
VIADTNQSGVPGFTDANFVAKKGQFKSIADLKGAVIGINAINSSSDAAGREFLAQHGLAVNKDYTLVEIRFNAMIPALKSGRIQVATLIPPFNHELLDTGEYEVLFSQGSSFGITQGSMWAAKADWLEKNRPAVTDFAEDFLRARRWMADPKNRDQALKMISDETKVPVSGLAHWMFTGRDYYRDPDGLPNVEAIQRNVDQANKAGILPVTINIKDHIDLSFMQEAKRRIEKP